MAATRAGLSRSNRHLGRLHAVLNKAFPTLRNEDDGLDVRALADKLGVTHTALYNAFKRETITIKMGSKLLKAAKGALSERALAPFLPVL